MQPRIMIGLLVAGVVAGIAYVGIVRPALSPSPEHASAESADNLQTEGLVTLTPEKLAAANLTLAVASLSPERSRSVVAGRLQYDDRRHVEIRSATSGMITQIPVKPGDRVSAGDVLVVLTSTDVGNARADALQRESVVKLATQRWTWEQQTCQGLTQLADAVRRRVAIEQIREQFRETILGKSREQLMTAYSELLLAEVLLNSAGKGADNGAVAGRVLEERRSAREQAEATLSATIEQLTFEAAQSSQLAESELADARQRLLISQQTVRTLLGLSPVSSNESDPASQPGEKDSDSPVVATAVPATHEPLSLVRLIAPFDGTIERRLLTQNERVEAGASILTLADTSTLWVAADLRERDWSALAMQPGETIEVTTASIAPASRAAVIHFAGREVDAQTNAIPLVAIVDNADGRLRPGMSARITLRKGDGRDAVMVPEQSVVQNDGRTFVFVPAGPRMFRPCDVVIGTSVDGQTEIVTGITAGQEIVASGVFLLKSELLLQGEDD